MGVKGQAQSLKRWFNYANRLRHHTGLWSCAIFKCHGVRRTASGLAACPALDFQRASARRQVQKTADDVAFRKGLPVRFPQAAVHLAAFEVPVGVAALVVPDLRARGAKAKLLNSVQHGGNGRWLRVCRPQAVVGGLPPLAAVTAV